MIYILLICISLLLIWTYSVYGKELFSPPVIVCMSFAFVVLCASYNVQRWRSVYEPYTVFVVVSGLAVFCLTSLLVRNHFNSHKNVIILGKNEIKLSKQKFLIGLGLSLICAYFIISTISASVDMRGINNMDDYAVAMSEYRREISYSARGGMSFLPRQSVKILEALQYIFLYIFCFNTVVRKSFLRNSIYLVPTLLYCYSAIRGGERAIIIQCISASICFFYLTSLKFHKRSGIQNTKIMVYVIIGVCLFLYMFSFLRQYVGRLNDENMIDYITEYGGGSIECFNTWLKSNHTFTNAFGEKTFYTLYKNLSSLGLTEDPGIVHSEFVFARNGILVGNVYTVFYRPMHDFGLLGMYAIQILEAWILTWLYEKAKRSKTSFSMYTLIYGLLSYVMFEYGIEECLFASNMSISFITKIILLWICGIFFLKHTTKVGVNKLPYYKYLNYRKTE